jgi:citronellol/citronellal dehydrogenase
VSDRNLAGTTMLMSGGSRGIGLAIALAAARDGANVALLAKTDQPHPKLEGTIHTAAAEIEAAGGKALAIVGDVREEASVEEAVGKTVEAFGGIDIVVNNASAIDLSPASQQVMKRYDLMQNINCRGTFLLSKTSLPYLEKSANGHILTLSPPIDMDPKWFGAHLGYTIAKYGMSMCTIGLAEEMKDDGGGCRVAANSLWPRTIIATAAVQNLLGGDDAMAASRSPEIMADAAHAILTRTAADEANTGNFYIDDEVLAEEGVTDLSKYGYGDGTAELALDLFLSE